MKKPELLAPAGDMESLKAAIEAGCDAIYLGGYMFGARSNASNFSNEEIKEAVIYAHLYGVKIYVTVNTLIYEDEVETFMNYIDFLYRNNVDAVIIQDLGMLDLVRMTYPLLEVHASTQMHLHNLEGVQFVQKLGVKRAVLAREMDINLIKEIKEKTQIEIEVFVHGALCISYSGQCLMSSLIGGRSGNRGSCAGSCRQKYDMIVNGKKVNEDSYLLSTKDLNTLEYLGELIESGVDSFKIEGRMKRPEYVYTVVKLYRKAIDEYCQTKTINIKKEELLELQKIFNRGFTKGFLFHETEKNLMNQKRPNHIGIPIGKVISYQKGFATLSLNDRLQNGDGIRVLGIEDIGTTITKILKDGKQVKEVTGGIVTIPCKEFVEKNSIVLKTTDKKQLDDIHFLLEKKLRKVSIFLELELNCGKKPILKLYDGKNRIEVIGNHIVEAAINAPISKEKILNQITKFGDSIYCVKETELHLDDNIFISVKELNDLRRTAISKLNQTRCYLSPYQKCGYHRQVPSFPVEKRKTIEIQTMLQYKMVEKKDWNFIYVEKESLFHSLKQDPRVILKKPRVLHHIKNDNSLVLTGELGSFYAFPNSFTDWSFNVTNSYTAAFLFSFGASMVTLSYELDENRLKLLINAYKKRYHAHPNFEYIVYGKEEVMISKFHLLDDFHIKNGFLKDRFSNLYLVQENKDFMKIYNYKPRKLTKNYYQLGINSLRYQMVDETEQKIRSIMDEFLGKDKNIE